MRKTDKKIDNRIIKALTEVCEMVKHELDGFKWISHEVNFQAFPQSLRVVCSFESTQHIQLMSDEASQGLYLFIKDALATEGISMHDVYRQVDFDVQ